MAENSEKTAKPEPKKRGRGRPFPKGKSGNAGGRPKLPEELKQALTADSLELYEKAKKLLDKATRKGSLQVAAQLVLGLLKKTIPDAQTLLVGDANGDPLKILAIDPKTLTKEQLEALIAIQKAQGAK
ncbi:MAG: hypothetical protein JNM17_04065 [Archangium sp.]|nr:hypothetical protein [Archangium sp.]